LGRRRLPVHSRLKVCGRSNHAAVLWLRNRNPTGRMLTKLSKTCNGIVFEYPEFSYQILARWPWVFCYRRLCELRSLQAPERVEHGVGCRKERAICVRYSQPAEGIAQSRYFSPPASQPAFCNLDPEPCRASSEIFFYGQQTRTELGVGSSSLLCDQARPNSVDMYRMPARSTTTIVEPCVAMQPVSAIPLIHVGRPSSTATWSPSGLVGRR